MQELMVVSNWLAKTHLDVFLRAYARSLMRLSLRQSPMQQKQTRQNTNPVCLGGDERKRAIQCRQSRAPSFKRRKPGDDESRPAGPCPPCS